MRGVLLMAMRNFRQKERSRSDITAKADDAFKDSGYAEYMVSKKVEGKYRLCRILMVLLYLAVAAVICVIFLNVIPYLIALVPIFIWILWRFTWLYVSQSYCYVVDGSYFTVTTVYGERKEADYVRIKLSDATMIAPLDDEYRHYCHADAGAVLYNAVSSFNAPDIYFIIAKDASDKKCVVFFEGTEHVLKAMKYYNSKAVMSIKTSR